jgi:hypothetical protein
LEIIAYLLARMIANDDAAARMILAEANGATTPRMVIKTSEKTSPKIDMDVVNRIYSLYPTKCPVSGRATGKSSKDKAILSRLLRDHTEQELSNTITRYVRECVEQNCYLKNFSTFLNNLPDYKTQTSNKELQTHVYYHSIEELEAARRAKQQ